MGEHLGALPVVLEAAVPQRRQQIPDPPGGLRRWLRTIPGSTAMAPSPDAPAAAVRCYAQWRRSWANCTPIGLHTLLLEALQEAGPAGGVVAEQLRIAVASTGWVELGIAQLSAAASALADCADALAATGRQINPVYDRFLRAALADGLRAGSMLLGPLIAPSGGDLGLDA